MNNSSINYNDLSYPNYVFADTHPSRLAAIGKFFGIDCPSSENADVLEIGCAGGMNILAHATSLPKANFLGIDPSTEQIKTAVELQKLSAISNVSFLPKRIEDLQSESDKYDYIICHGVFSWVNKNTQHEILKACRTLLTENGIAYISYNTLPGWHIQRIIRDALIYRSEDVSGAQEQARVSKAFLNFSKDLFPKAALPLLQPTIEHLLEVPDSYLAHEHLAEINSPLYFHEFNDLLNQHGLIYLAESELGSMIPKEFEPAVQDKLLDLSTGNLSKMEQYCDILRLRQFRKTLICKDSCDPIRQLDPQRLMSLFVSAAKSHLTTDYKCKEGLANEGLQSLIEKFPNWIAVKELYKSVTIDELPNKLMESLMLDLIEIRDFAGSISSESLSLEALSPLARSLIPFGNIVPNLRSDTVALSSELHTALKSAGQLSKSQLSELSRLGLLG